MNASSIHSTAAPSSLPANSLTRNSADLATQFNAKKTPAEKIAELHDRFTQFVGETFYGQMLKSMQATVGKPAYFDGGRGEEVFRGQLNQTLAEHMSKAAADRFADPLFHRQFPQLSLDRK